VLGLAPASFEPRLELPEGARLFRQLRPTPFDVIIVFVDRLAELERRFGHADRARHAPRRRACGSRGPSRRRGAPPIITEDVVRRVGLAGGLVDNKVCAIDETWSGLRLVVRVENRAAVAYRAEPPLSVRRRRATATVPATGSSGRRAEARRR
jgi:hypothetical protein